VKVIERNNKSSHSLLTKLLSPASFAYGAASYLRLKLYSSGYLEQTHLPVKVISIGNITCGGTGKTPITIDLARRLIKANNKVAILSRGYRRKSTDKFLVVSAGNGPIVDASTAGDEPFMISKNVPEAIVIVGSKRKITADIAIKKYGCNIILLDDGFQHIQLSRSEDIVLIDYNDDLHKQALLPAGRLREPLSALARAQSIVITKVPKEKNEKEWSDLNDLIAKYAPQTKISSCRFTSYCLEKISNQESVSLNTIAGKKIIAFCGIAQPKHFYKELESYGADIVFRKSFADHHWYSHKDIHELKSNFNKYNADIIVTTSKDAVRLLPDLVQQLPILTLKQEVEWLGAIPINNLLVTQV
jgi:tetraacyldisaccharide 4'-kinase